MLFVLNIGIILLVLGMAALWATYGFYSGFLQLMVIIVAGVLALAVWEPLSFWLLGRMPGSAHGVGLLAPFALLIILLRTAVDKTCRMNVQVPRLADQIGGGLCGVAAGVLAFGMLLNGASFLPIARDALGWEPYAAQGNQIVHNEDGQIWGFARVHVMSANFFEMLSGGSMSPMGSPGLLEARPNLAERAGIYRMPIDTNQRRSTHPDGVNVQGVYAVEATVNNVKALVERAAIISILAPSYETPADVSYGEGGMGLVNAIKAELTKRYNNPEANGSPTKLLNGELILEVRDALGLDLPSPTGDEESLLFFIDTLTNRLVTDLLYDPSGELNAFGQALGQGKTLFIVDTRWNGTTPGTFGEDNYLRLPMSQVRLQVQDGKELKLVPPAGFSIEYNQNNKGRLFTPAVIAQPLAYSSDSEFSMGLAFLLDEGQSPVRFFARELRFDLTELKPAEGADSPVVQNPGAIARVMGVPSLPAGKPDEDAAPQVTADMVQIASTGIYARVSEALPRAIGAADSSSLTNQKEGDRSFLLSGAAERIGVARATLQDKMRAIHVPDSDRLISITLDSKQAGELYGQARQLPESLNRISLKDANGNVRNGIGFVLVKTDNTMDVNIRDSVRDGGMHASELPAVNTGESITLYFQVPVGQTVTSFVLGAEEQLFEEPIEVGRK